MTVNLVLSRVDGVLVSNKRGEYPVRPPPRGGRGRGRRENKGRLESRERNRRHHELGFASRNRSRWGETKGTGSRTTGHDICK